MNLGENIYKHRTAKKLSQEDFAANLEVSRQSVSKWENNQAVPELEKLIKMAKLFDISLDELVGNAPPPSPAEAAIAPVSIVVPVGDLISIILLTLIILIPLLVWVTGELHNSTLLFLVSVFALPPLFTFSASKLSPHNQTIRKAFLVLNIAFSVVVFLLSVSDPYLGIALAIIYLIPIFSWPANSER